MRVYKNRRNYQTNTENNLETPDTILKLRMRHYQGYPQLNSGMMNSRMNFTRNFSENLINNVTVSYKTDPDHCQYVCKNAACDMLG